MKKALLLVMLVLALGLAACGGDSAPADSGEPAADSVPAGNASAGEKVFNEAAPACTTCHSLEPGKDGIGPSLATIGADAASRVSGQSAEDYLVGALKDPDGYVVDGFAAGVMPGTYGSQLSEEQITDLVAYLLSLK